MKNKPFSLIKRIKIRDLLSNYLYIFCLILLSLLHINSSWASDKNRLNKTALSNSVGVLLCTENGNVIYSKNAQKAFVPASTIKVLTSLSARYYLGEDYRFKTEFFIDSGVQKHTITKNIVSNSNLKQQFSHINLKIKGYGDPLFTSAIIRDTCHKLSLILRSKNIKYINNIIVDNTFFASNINIDGKSDTNNPYDAFVGALSANFNTVAFQYSKREQCYISDDPETPLIPFVMNRVQSSGLKRGRVVLSEQESRLYAGMLIQHFLSQEGIAIKGIVTTGTIAHGDTLLYRFVSPYDIDEITRRLLDYSSNFMANQLFLSTGAQAFSPPATVEKGVAAMAKYAKQIVGILPSEQLNSVKVNHSNYLDSQRSNLFFVEGSGLSRKNRISPADMIKVLKQFKPNYHLMKRAEIVADNIKLAYSGSNYTIARSGNEYYKTGTLNSVKTRCGYFQTSQGLYPFVIMVNESGAGYDKIRQSLWKSVLAYEGKI